MQNFSVQIQDFRSPNKIPKDYTLGVMFESSLIEEKIATIQRKFLRTFLVLFMAPFLMMVTFFLICEVLFLIHFTRRIFSTINNLFEKIQMLSQQHSKSFKLKKKQGNDNIALLNYNQVANLFQERSIIQQSKPIAQRKEKGEWEYINPNEKTSDAMQQQDDEIGVKFIFKDPGLSSKLAICYNNIGCVHAKQRRKGKQNVYFQEAIRIEEFIIKNNQLEKKCTSIEDNLRIACKYFNFGYSLSRQFLFYVKMTAAGKLGKSKLLPLIVISYIGYYLVKDDFGTQSLIILKKSYLHFNSIQSSLVEESKIKRSAADGNKQQLQWSRSLRDFGLYIRVRFRTVNFYSY
ncbi:hypothetical protein FGO68_gene1070 [Halteria grandinella]|uniref:Transmembrane protein n=1 Tax=Halteria grandinella TaxID=5974 RepID=A0A8J8P3K7_HALGN|nr:hypothetical protein FGO68_gene1070 [Halteria grandinella]